MTPERGTFWRNLKTGRVFEVVHISAARGDQPARVQLKPAEAKNLKNTRWLDLWKLPMFYAPAEEPLPPTLAERIVAEISPPQSADVTVSVSLSFPWGPLGPDGWAVEAVEFVRRYPGASWKWMNVPNNERKKGEGWFSLDVRGRTGGVDLHMGGPGGWTQAEAQALTESLKAALAETKPPPVEPDHRCPRCAHGWTEAEAVVA